MGENSAIEWTDHTFNPWIGCEKVSPGCAHCYAETLVQGRMNRANTWGAEGVRQRTAESTWKQPLRWEKAAAWFASEYGRRQRVFCASLADVFEPRPELAVWRRDLFHLINLTPSLDWLILTKRPEEALEFLLRVYMQAEGFPSLGLFRNEWVSRDGIDWGMPPNVWMGVSIENVRFTWRADVLREIPAAVRFLSCEPLLGSLFSESAWKVASRERWDADHGEGDYDRRVAERVEHPSAPLNLEGIDWVIVGGESGGKAARPMHPDWAREILAACANERITRKAATPAPDSWTNRPAFLFKQWGSWQPVEDGGFRYAGPHPTAGGRLLDGRTWDEAP